MTGRIEIHKLGVFLKFLNQLNKADKYNLKGVYEMEVLWFIPTHGDSRYLGTIKGGRLADFSYFRQVAQSGSPSIQSANSYWKVLRRSLDIGVFTSLSY